MPMDLTTTNTLIALGAVLVSVGGSWFVMGYRLNRIEADRKEDRRGATQERRTDNENFQRTISELSARVDAVDERMRKHSGNLYEAVDDIRGAGGILESRTSALETVLDPARVHEHNRQQGAQEQKLSDLATSVQRLEDHLIDMLRLKAK